MMQKRPKDRENSIGSPINRCLRSYPVLSFRKVPSMSSTVPFAKTASRPEKLVEVLFLNSSNYNLKKKKQPFPLSLY